MRKTLYVLLIPLLMACEFKAEKVLSGCSSDLYLISNGNMNPNEMDQILFEFVKENRPNLCCLDSTISYYSVAFYSNTSCTRGFIRGYIKSRDESRDIESIDERCENWVKRFKMCH